MKCYDDDAARPHLKFCNPTLESQVSLCSRMTRPRSYSQTSSNSTFSINTLSSLPSDARSSVLHARHATTTANPPGVETEMALGSMYDYLVKFILIGPSGCGK
jgi:hypothetical protein